MRLNPENRLDWDYCDLIGKVLESNNVRETRNGQTKHIFGGGLTTHCMRLGQFPILTSRKLFYKPVFGELAAFLRGATDLQTFKDFGCNYWDANAKAWVYNKTYKTLEDLDVGNIYGAKWRNFYGLDQIEWLVSSLRDNPKSRRHVLTAYDPSEDWQCLPPCHLMAQFNVDNTGYLDCIVYMRSVDLCLGLPSDIILYATLTILLANECGYKPGTLTFFTGDTHIYLNHIEGFTQQLKTKYSPLPTWKLATETSIDDFRPEHLELINYQHGERIDFPFSV